MKKICHLTFAAFAFGLSACSSASDEPINPDPQFVPRLAPLSAVDYRPAPGQFVNEIPEYEPGDTPESMNRKALQSLNNGDLISLGAFGGQVVVTLRDPIVAAGNGRPDFRVLGNAYLTGSFDGRVTASAEPGIVYVMDDVNANGLPDDTWYQLRGEMYARQLPAAVTFTPLENPTADHWVEWSVNGGASKGFLSCNLSYHNHTYFPEWLPDAPMSVEGVMLPVNGFYDTDAGQYRQFAYAGYADSYPNNADESKLSISDAVDADGNSVALRQIRFIKIVTGVLDSNGPLGECSTEIGGIQLLHE